MINKNNYFLVIFGTERDSPVGVQKNVRLCLCQEIPPFTTTKHLSTPKKGTTHHVILAPASWHLWSQGRRDTDESWTPAQGIYPLAARNTGAETCRQELVCGSAAASHQHRKTPLKTKIKAERHRSFSTRTTNEQGFVCDSVRRALFQIYMQERLPVCSCVSFCVWAWCNLCAVSRNDSRLLQAHSH